MANLYWVWGTWNWSDATNHWATSSGWAPWAWNLPTATDDVFFDTLSNALAYTVTIDATTKLCRDITFWAPLVWDVTWAWSVAMNISGSMTLYAGLVRTYTGALTFNATTTGKTLTFAGKTMASATTFNWVGWGWTLQDNWNNGGATITLTNGALDTNAKTVTTTNTFSSSNSNTRTLNITSSTINCVGWTFTTVTGLTFTSTSSTIIVTWVWGFFGGWLTYATVQLNGTAHTISWANTFTTFTRTGTATKTDTFTLSANQTISGTLTLNGNSVTNRLLILSNTIWTARTITAWTVSVSNADFKDITWAWAGSWNLSAITWLSWDCWGNSGITFTTPTIQYAKTWVSANWSGAIWFTTSGWATPWRVPLPQDTAIFDANSITAWSVVITQDMPRIPTVNWTWVTNTPTWTTSTLCSCFGSITLVTWMTLTASTQTYTFEWRSTHTLTNAGKTWAKTFSVNAPWGTLTITDDLTMGVANTMTVISGTFSAVNGGTNSIVTVGAFSIQGTSTITLGSATHLLTGSGTNVFSMATTGTLTATTGTLKITDTANTNNSFGGGGKTYNNIWWSRGASTGNITITGSNTFAEFKDTWTTAHSILFTAWTTQTITTWSVTWNAWQLITINSTTTATHALVKSWGWTISADYLNIQHSVATPANTWYAGTNSVNNQAVATAWSWWIFTAPPAWNNSWMFFAFASS